MIFFSKYHFLMQKIFFLFSVGIALKTPAMKKSLDKVMGKWNDMQSKSQLFVERYIHITIQAHIHTTITAKFYETF